MGILVDSVNAERKRRQEQKRAEWERKLMADATAAEERKRQRTSLPASGTTASTAPKTAEQKEADINRREKNRSVQYSMLPEVRAGAIKRAEAAGDTDKVRELSHAEDIEAWAKEQTQSDSVKKEAQRRYDEEFLKAKARGDENPAIAAMKAGDAYLDLYRGAAQKTRDNVYNYRQDEKKTEMEGVQANSDFEERAAVGREYTSGSEYKDGKYNLSSPFGTQAEVNRIMSFVNGTTDFAGQYGEDKARVDQMTEGEKDTIRYFAANGELEKVKEYYKLLERSLNKRVQEVKNKETYEKAYENPGAGVIKNVGASFGTVGAYIDNAGNALGNIFRDEYVPTDPNSWAFGAAHTAKQTSRGVSDRAYDAAGGGNLGEVARFFTETGLSMANFLSKAPLGPTGAMIAMGADTAGQTTLDVLERGGTPGQAFLLSTAAGTIEALTEKMPLDNLFRTAKEVGKTGAKATIKSVLKQAGMEATEEVVSELANTALDIAVMREKSEYQSYITELEKSGMSREEAEKEAFFQFFGMNLIKAGAGGALSGAAMGGGASAISAINTNINRSRVGGGFTKTEFSGKITNKQIRALRTIGRALGVNISIGAPTGDGKGAYNGYYENGNIVIAQDAKNPLEVVLCHEVTHRMKETAPAEYTAFLELAVNASEKLSGAEKGELINRYKTAYSEGTQSEFSDIQALDEIAADFTSRIVKDVKMFERLAQDNRTVATKLLDGIRDFIAKVKSTFSYDKAKADTASQEKYGASISELEAAVAQFEKMLETTKTAVASGNINININTAGTNADGGRMYDLKGKRADGIEVYETSEEVRVMPWKDRKKRFLNLMENEFLGRTAKFTKNGQTYYARFDAEDINKIIYGDTKSDDAGKDAKINTGADGLIFELVENSQYDGSAKETGKPGKAHKKVGLWDYFIKKVQIDGKVFDLIANVRKKSTGEFVYSLQLNEDKNIEAAPPENHTENGGVNGAQTASNNIIPDSSSKSNRQNSLKTEDLLSPDYGKSADTSADGEGSSNGESYIEETGLDKYFDDIQERAQGVENGESVAVLEKAPEREYNGDNKEKGDVLYGRSRNKDDGRTVSTFETDDAGAERKASEGIGRVLGTDGVRQSIHRGARRLKEIARETNPVKGSVAESSKNEAEQHGIKAYVFSAADWEESGITSPACSLDGEIYMRENISEEHRGAIVPHERIHIMKQSGYTPYLRFVGKAPVMLNIGSKECMLLLEQAAKHRGIDIFDVSEEGQNTLYDEVNSIVFGSLKAKNISINMDVLRKAFKNFDAWYNELSQILDDFTQQAQQNSNEEATDAEDAFAVSSSVSGEKGNSEKGGNKKAKDGMKVSRVRSNTIQRSGIFSEEELQNPELEEGKFKYKPTGEDETQRRARERIAEGRNEAREYIENKEDWDGTDADTAFELLRMERADAAESGDWVRVGELARLIQKRATKAGQEIQAHAKYTRTAEKTIVEATENIENSHLVSKEDIELLKKLIKRFVNDRGELDTARMDKALTEFLKEEPKVRKKRVRKVFRELISAKKEEMGKMGFLMETEKTLSSHMEDTVKAQEIMKTVSGAADLIYSIKENGKASKDKLIELIKKQAAIRGHNISKANEQRLLGEDFEFLYETAEKQLRAITEDYIPRSLGQKLSTVQSLGQLLQVPTYLTNIISNRAFGLVDKQTANTFGIVFDRVISLATKQKTVGYEHTFGHGIHEAGKKAKNRAKINASLDVKSGEPGRYGTGTTRTFKTDDSRWKVTKFLSNVEKLLTYELNVPDEAQKGRIRRSVTESLIPLVESGQMSVEEVTEIAVDEARYRTFQDDNLPSKIIGELKKVFNHIGTKDFGLGDFICKYTQVAGALIERTLEYSPGGYIKGIYNLYEMAREGMNAKKQREAALAFARGTTGTGLIAIGTLLSSLKIVFREDDEKDDNIRALNSAEGVVGTKINLSAMGRLLTGKSTEAKKDDVLLSVDRFEPFNMFLTAGAEIAKAENKSIGNIALTSISGATKSIRELSVIQTIDEFFKLLEYSGDKDQIALASELAIFFGESTVGSFIPSAVRRSARAFDNSYRDAYADNSEMGIALRQLGSSIPGLRNTLPEKLDNFGNAKTYTDNWLLNAGNALVAPFEVSKYKKSDVSRELERVRKETGSTSIYPAKNAPYSIKYDGEKYILHAEARERYQKMRGNTYYRLIFEALKNERYKKLNVDQQAAILENFKEYATDKAKEEFFGSVRVEYERDATAWDADEEKLKGVKVSDFYIDKYAQGVEKKEKSDAREKTRRKALG